MAKKKFKVLSPEEVAALTPEKQEQYELDLAAFNKENGGGAQAEEEEEEETDELVEAAKKYFANNKNYGFDSILVSSDKQFFYPSVQGKNNLANHLASLPEQKRFHKEVYK